MILINQFVHIVLITAYDFFLVRLVFCIKLAKNLNLFPVCSYDHFSSFSLLAKLPYNLRVSSLLQLILTLKKLSELAGDPGCTMGPYHIKVIHGSSV